MLRQCASIYAELIKVGISPAQADQLELWQIAALQAPSQNLRGGLPLANPQDAELERQLIAARYKAAREGRELDATEVMPGISPEQMARIIQ